MNWTQVYQGCVAWNLADGVMLDVGVGGCVP